MTERVYLEVKQDLKYKKKTTSLASFGLSLRVGRGP